MIPAFTAANLLAWSIQVAAVVLLGGAAIRLAGLQSPRVRLACFRLLLVACLLLPFLPTAATGSMTDASAAPDANSRVLPPSDASTVPASSDVVTPANASRTVAAGGAGRMAWLPAWAAVAGGVVLALGAVARLGWLLVGLLALGRLRREAVRPGLKAGTYGCPRSFHRGFQASLRLRSGQAAWDDRAGADQQGLGDVLIRAIDLAGASADIVTSAAVKHPVTFGLRHPVVLLPESCAALEDSEQVAVVCHELLHVRRHDWLHIVAEELLRAVLWFHPAIWWLLGRIDLSREQMVDQDVIALTAHRRPYVNALVTLALTPAGSILRPASLFLGRAHLLQRVALLSREVRMSRPRLCLSLILVITALLAGGRFVVHAFPLTEASSSPPAVVSIAPPALPALAIALRGEPVLPALPTAPAPAAAAPASAAGPALESPQTRTPFAEVLQRAEPIVPGQPPEPGTDVILTAQVTVQPAGDAVMSGPVEMFMGQPGKRSFEAKFSGPDSLARMNDMVAKATGGPYAGDAFRAAVDALRMWRFAAIEQPFTTVIGFNLARGDQSGGESVPVRVGGDVPAPVRIRNVAPIYPLEAQDKHIQGVVILELVIDGAGIPISAYVLRPVEGLSMAAVQAALQWRYTPDATYSRRLMTVTANFTLSGVTGGIVAGAPGYPPPPPPPPDAVGIGGGVAGGVQGGVVGGVASGVVGGVAASATFGLPRSEWPSPVRVGGNIQAPTRTVKVDPVYPAIAQTAKVQGVVILEVLIGTDGTVQAGQILRSIPLLDQAAIDAVRQWQYRPTLLNGNPVSVVMTVTVNFTLQ